MTDEKLNYKKIATLANVGIGTVSRYFNNGSISQKNIEKISAVVKKLNFNPNFRILLKHVQQKTIHIIVSSFAESITTIIEGIEEGLKNEYQILIIKASLNPREYLKKLRYILKQKPENLILFLPEMNSSLKQFIQNIKFTNLLIYGDLIEGVNSLINQELESFYQLTKNIIEKNKLKEINFIGKKLEDIFTGKMRYQGVLKATEELNVKLNYQFIQENHSLEVLNAFKKLKLNIAKENFIISGTHTIFETLVLLKQQNNIFITDVGYNTYLDGFKQYESKVFIDYFLIGIQISKFFIENIKNKHIVWKNNFIL